MTTAYRWLISAAHAATSSLKRVVTILSIHSYVHPSLTSQEFTASPSSSSSPLCSSINTKLMQDRQAEMSGACLSIYLSVCPQHTHKLDRSLLVLVHQSSLILPPISRPPFQPQLTAPIERISASDNVIDVTSRLSAGYFLINANESASEFSTTTPYKRWAYFE